MSSDWKEYVLEDALSALIDYRGKTPRKTTSGVPLVTAKIIKGGRIQKATEFIAASEYDAWMRRGLPKKGDVLLTVEAPLGEVAQLGAEKIALAQRVVTLRGKPGVLDSTFLLYLLQSTAVQQKLRERASGSTVLGIKQSELRRIPVTLPPHDYQLRVARVLKSLDNLAECVRLQNHAMEAVAAGLYHSWFVDFAPVRAALEGREPVDVTQTARQFFPKELVEEEDADLPGGWSRSYLGNLCEAVRDQEKPKSIPLGTPYVGLEHVPRKSLSMAEWGKSDSLESGKFRFKRNDILFGKLRPYFHKVTLAPMDGVCSTDIFVIRPKDEQWLPFVLLTVFSDSFIAHATRLSDGARMPRTSWRDVAKYPIVLPPRELVEEFGRVTAPLLKALHANISLERCLTSLRAVLLPGLVSGALSVGEAEVAVEQCLEDAVATA